MKPHTLWRHRDFLLLWTGQTISVFGSQFTHLAVPLIAAMILKASPAQMGILSAVVTAPFLLIGLFAGVWVDRWPRRPVLITGNVGRALVLSAIPIAYLADALSMPLLYTVGFLTGVLTVFFDVAYQAYLPSLVGRAHLVEGNSKLEASRSTAQIAGPGLAGVVVQIVSAPMAIVFDALSFLVSGLFIGLIRQLEPAPESVRAPMLGEIREGLAVVFGNPMLRAIAGCTGTSNFFASVAGALYILFVTRELGMKPVAIGAVFSLGSLGALAGVLLAGSLARRLGIGRVIVAAPLISGLGFVPVVLATPALAVPLLTLGALVSSFGYPIYNISQVSLRQAITPHRLQGRMNATMRFLVWGTMPLGALAGGALGQVLGLRPTIAIAAAGAALAFVWVWRSPVRALRQIPEPPGPAD
ncbi:MAG: MFS transporter [bacterium]|nr:MFS transporter [bacterium]